VKSNENNMNNTDITEVSFVCLIGATIAALPSAALLRVESEARSLQSITISSSITSISSITSRPAAAAAAVQRLQRPAAAAAAAAAVSSSSSRPAATAAAQYVPLRHVLSTEQLGQHGRQLGGERCYAPARRAAADDPLPPLRPPSISLVGARHWQLVSQAAGRKSLARQRPREQATTTGRLFRMGRLRCALLTAGTYLCDRVTSLVHCHALTASCCCSAPF
jgi:hypothetical protein